VAEYRSSLTGQCPPPVLKYTNLCEAALLRGTWPDACWHVNRGAVVMDSRLGFCSQGHGRACKYLLVLREPVARLVSSYNYFCVSCMEGRACKGGGARRGTCPFLSLLAYAQLVGPDSYLRQLDPMGTFDPMDMGEQRQVRAVSRWDQAERLQALKRVRAHLKHAGAILIPLERLHAELMRGAPKLAGPLSDPPWPAEWATEFRRSSHSTAGALEGQHDRGAYVGALPDHALRSPHELSDEERVELNRLLEVDIALYNDTLRSRDAQTDAHI